MSVAGLSFGTSASFGMTFANLASSATVGVASTPVDASVTPYLDYMVQFRFKLLTGVPTADQAVYLYVYGSEDGTDYPDGISAGGGSYTFRSPTNLIYIQSVGIAVTGQLVCISTPISISMAFNGVLPRKWGIVIRNYTGLAYTATESDHAARYTPVQMNIF
jgi:hypothetical protein